MDIVKAVKTVKNELIEFITKNLQNKSDITHNHHFKDLIGVPSSAEINKVFVQEDEPIQAENGSIWIDVNSSHVPTTTVMEIPEVTEADNGKVMMVINGEWDAVDLATVEGESF